MGDSQDTPTPVDARSWPKSSRSSSPYTLPTSTKPKSRSERSLPAPGNGVNSSPLSVILRVPPMLAPVTSRGPSVPCSKPRTEPRPPE